MKYIDVQMELRGVSGMDYNVRARISIDDNHRMEIHGTLHVDDIEHRAGFPVELFANGEEQVFWDRVNALAEQAERVGAHD